MAHLFESGDWEEAMVEAGDKLVVAAFLDDIHKVSGLIDQHIVDLRMKYKGIIKFLVVEAKEGMQIFDDLEIQETPLFWFMKKRVKLEEFANGYLDQVKVKLDELIEKYLAQEQS